ncbi:MAG: hypothetical protein WBV55_05545 [Candidatus Sulfotelmatobacter sp.]
MPKDWFATPERGIFGQGWFHRAAAQVFFAAKKRVQQAMACDWQRWTDK